MTDFPIAEEKKLRILKEYPSEILVSILILSVLGIWGKMTGMEGKIDSLQTEIKTYMTEDRKTMVQCVNQNTEALDKNTKAFSDVADYLRITETRKALKD